MVTLYQYWKDLTPDERKKFCSDVGASYNYMESHLIHGRKKPSMEKIQAIVDASNEKLTHKGLFEFFLNRGSAA